MLSCRHYYVNEAPAVCELAVNTVYRALGAVALVNYSIALSGLRLGLVDPGQRAARLPPGYPLPRLRRCLSRSFCILTYLNQ